MITIKLAGKDNNYKDLKNKEICFIYAKSELEIKKQHKLINEVCNISSRVILCLPENVLYKLKSMKILDKLIGIYGISVSLRRPNTNSKNKILERKKNIKDRFHAIKTEFGKNLLVIPEVIIEEDINSMDGIGIDLMNLAHLGCPWIFLSVQGPPTDKKASKLRDCFNYLEMRGFPETDIYFSFNNPDHFAWTLKTECHFSGPSYVHMDISNKCTHSCLFCGLYSPIIIKENRKKSGGQLNENLIKFMAAQLPYEKAIEILESLPVFTRQIQFGGAGDPLTHLHAIEFIEIARNKGISVEILTNMEYFNANHLSLLTQLGSDTGNGIRIIANISAASANTYVQIRPKQTEKQFEKVIENLSQFKLLREKNNGKGVFVTFMSVMNRLNYLEASEMVQLAWELGAERIWLKPLEIHDPSHIHLLPLKEEKSEYRHALMQAVHLADRIGIHVQQREAIEL